MEKRRLGRTNHMSSVVIFGSAAFSEISQEKANEALDLALAHGVNHIDVAPQYGQAEERIGPWLESRRDQFFLGCKTLERGREGAWAQLHRSLEKLHTDRLDLHQLHAITSFEELDRAIARGGAIEALVQAREQGLTRWLGITGHGIHSPAVFAQALERFDFDTIMYPIHPRLYADPQYRRDSERLLQMAADRDVGVMIIKSITRAAWGTQTKNYNVWYQPYDTPQEIEQGVRFALSQPGVTGIPSAGDVRLLPMVIEAAERFTPMSKAEQEALIEASKELDPMFYEGQKF
jgi:aryl-alcohol dehydrogenase-like predicted oxidoreductase